jgi:hypothetical protein
LFRRRRDTDDDRLGSSGKHARREPEPGDTDSEAEDWVAGMTSDPVEEPAATGPWDSHEKYPPGERVDLGSLLVPVRADQQIQLEMTEDQNFIIAVTVATATGRLQMRALAAPKSGGLWDDERVDIATTITGAGGQAHEADGPFGPEMQVQEPPAPGSGETTLQPARYIGVDGPRWLLTAKISGPAASHPDLARPLEAVLADIVVVRGDHPAPPRDLLEIQLPMEMRQAIAQQMAEAEAEAAQGGQAAEYPNPFERGPEITETR